MTGIIDINLSQARDLYIPNEYGVPQYKNYNSAHSGTVFDTMAGRFYYRATFKDNWKLVNNPWPIL